MNYVLVVDDDEVIREMVSLALLDEGYTVVNAMNGRDALAKLAAQPTPPALILLDMRMPIMDGWSFAQAYRETTPQPAPIVVLTAATDAAAFAADVSAVGYLAKPFDIDNLLKTVEHYAGPGQTA